MPILTLDALPLLGTGGTSQYVRPFARALAASPPENWRTEYWFRLGTASRLRAYRRFLAQQGFSGVLGHRTLIPDRLLPFFPWVAGGKAGSVFLATTDFVPRLPGKKTGWLVYDLAPLRIPRFFPGDPLKVRLEMEERARRASFIIAISQTTRDDLMELLKVPEERIFVGYPGTAPAAEAPRSAAEPGQRPYIYYVGALSKNKNVDGLLRVFSRCIHKHRLDLDLWLTGRDFCGRKFWEDLIDAENLEGRVHFTGWLPDAQLHARMRGAAMLWQFSWYEGFGLPVLEAAAQGVPVLYTNRGSVKEILGSGEQEIDPEDVEGAAWKAAVALQAPDILAEWRERGLRRARDFSWEETAAGFWAWLPSVI